MTTDVGPLRDSSVTESWLCINSSKVVGFDFSMVIVNRYLFSITRKFEEEQDAEFARMRMIAIREEQETMERGVRERDWPSTWLHDIS
jgi:hypothetical protein